MRRRRVEHHLTPTLPHRHDLTSVRQFGSEENFLGGAELQTEIMGLKMFRV